MRRDEWVSSLCTAVMRALPDDAVRTLRSFPDLDTPADPWRTPDLGPAVTAVEMARRYASGDHPDDILAWCERAGFESSREATLDLIVAVCEIYRTCRLPLDRWWRPDELTGLLLRWYVRWRLAAGGPDTVVPELIHRWDLSEDEATDVLVNATADIADAPGIFTEPGFDPASRWLRKVAASKQIRTIVDAALARYPAALRDRDDLLAMARYRETHAAIAARLNAATGWRDPVVDAAVEQLNAAMETSGSVLLSLSPCERRLLEPDGALESMFARVMALRRHTITIDGAGGANALPDRVGGTWRSTEWLTDYVYQQGGRVMCRSAGPMAHWTLVLEDVGDALAVAELLDDPDYMPRGGLADTAHLAAFHLQLDDDPADPMICEFAYHDMPEGLLDLVVLAQTRRVRLDVFALRDGLLAGVGTRTLAIPDGAIARLLDRMVPRLEALLADADLAARVRLGSVRADDWTAFLAVDAAKSAELLAALDPELLIGVPALDARRRKAFRAAREALLDALVARSNAAAAGNAIDTRLVDEARTRYARTIQQMRAPARGSSPLDRDDASRASALVNGLAGETRAVLTLTLSRSSADGSTRLSGYWVAGDGPGHVIGTIPDSAVSLEQLQAAARLPLQEPSDLDALIAATPALGRDLVAPLLERGIRTLTVVPVSLVHALPLHLWPATGDPRGPRLCDVFETIAYAPSLSLLQQLSRLEVRSQGSVVAAVHGPDLTFAKPEADALSILAGRDGATTSVSTKEALSREAGRADLLHLGCHGTWIIGDYWRSGLSLDGESAAARWLSVAEIQQTLHLSGTSLVCLSACDSGVSASDIWRVDDYLGIDGAFLACGARAVVSSLWSVTDLVSVLFTATMYHALATGATISEAHRTAVTTFASGAYRGIDNTHPVGALLTRAGVDWQQELRDLDEVADELRHPFYWGVFKLSGLVDRPVPSLQGGVSR